MITDTPKVCSAETPADAPGTAAADAPADALAAAAAATCRPWVKPAGPFDHCPQRPEPGKTLRYFEAQEGQLAAAADPLVQGTKLTRHDLPPAKPVAPASAGVLCIR